MGHRAGGSPLERPLQHHQQQHSVAVGVVEEQVCSQLGVAWACLCKGCEKQGLGVQGYKRQLKARRHARCQVEILPHLTLLLSFFSILLLQPVLVTSQQPPPGTSSATGATSLNDDYQSVASQGVTSSTFVGATPALAADYVAPSPSPSPYGIPSPATVTSPPAYPAPSPVPYFSPVPPAAPTGLPTLYLSPVPTPSPSPYASPVPTLFTLAATASPPYTSPATSPVPSPSPTPYSPVPSPSPSPLPASPYISPSPSPPNTLYLPSPSPSPAQSPYVPPSSPSPSPPYCPTPQFSSNLTSHCSTSYDTNSCKLTVSCIPWCSGGQLSLTQLDVRTCNMGYVTAVCDGTVTCGTPPPSPSPNTYYIPSPSPYPSPSPTYNSPFYYSPSAYSPAMLNVPPGWAASLQCGVTGTAVLQFDNIRATISAALSIDVANVLVARSSEVITVLYRVTDNNYVSKPYGYASTACNNTLLKAMSGALCSQLGLPDCSMVSTGCWYFGHGQTDFPAWPPSAYQPLKSGCAAYLIATIKLDAGINSAQMALTVYRTTIQLPGYQVQVPGTGDMAASPVLNYTLAASQSAQLTLSTTTVEQRTAILLGLQVTCYASAVVLYRVVSATSPSPISPALDPSPYQPPYRPTLADCPKPHLGALCGKDATGAFVGIAIGAFVILCLFCVTLYFMFRKGRRTTVVCDEFHWAANHQHIQNSCPAAYHPAVVRGTPYAVQCHGQSPSHASYHQ